MLRCRSGDEDVRDIFEDEKFKVYPRVKESSKVVFLTALNNESGREILDTRIVKTHKFLIDKYCSTPHEYWCITNEKIDGVDTIPFELDPNREIIGWNAQYELFRNLFPGRPIMTLDFDCVPTRPFTLHDIPDGYFSMMYQTTSTPESVPIVIFNTGTTYFKGDFSFIFEKFKEFIRAKIPPTMYFTTIQDVVAYESAMRGISVHSVSKAVDVMLVKLDHPSYKKAYGQVRNHDFVHYLGYVKPWSVDRLKRLKLQHLVPGEFMNMESGAF